MIEDSRQPVLGYRREPDETHPPYLYKPYRGTIKRSPLEPLVVIPQTLSEITGRVSDWERLMGGAEADLTVADGGEPLGERIVVSGRVLDEDGRPIRNTMIEIWQANAAGRYLHARDQHPAPIDPHFAGSGRVKTDEDGRYRFVTVKPGAYPWETIITLGGQRTFIIRYSARASAPASSPRCIFQAIRF